MDQKNLLIKTLPLDMVEEIKSKIGLRFHNGFWSAWLYNNVKQTLIVELGKLHTIDSYEEQIEAIHLLIDMNLVDTLILRTCFKSFNRLQSGLKIDRVEQLDLSCFSYFLDFIDTRKFKNVIIDRNSIEYETDYLNGPSDFETKSFSVNKCFLKPSRSYKDALLQL